MKALWEGVGWHLLLYGEICSYNMDFFLEWQIEDSKPETAAGLLCEFPDHLVVLLKCTGSYTRFPHNFSLLLTFLFPV